MVEFEVIKWIERQEGEGKKLIAQRIKITLENPPERLAQKIRNERIKLAIRLAKLKKNLDSPESLSSEELEETLEIVQKETAAKNKSINELLVQICTNGAITSENDLESIGSADLAEMRKWIEEKIGLLENQEKKGFTKT